MDEKDFINNNKINIQSEHFSKDDIFEIDKIFLKYIINEKQLSQQEINIMNKYKNKILNDTIKLINSKHNDYPLFKYYSFSSKYIKEVFNSFLHLLIYTPSLKEFEDENEYKLNENIFSDNNLQFAHSFNNSNLNEFKILCTSKKFNDKYLLENYCKNNGFIVEFSPAIIKKFVFHNQVSYVKDKSKEVLGFVNKICIKNQIKIKNQKNFSSSKIYQEISQSLYKTILTKTKKFEEEKEYRLFNKIEEKFKYIKIQQSDIKKIYYYNNYKVLSPIYILKQISFLSTFCQKMGWKFKCLKI